MTTRPEPAASQTIMPQMQSAMLSILNKADGNMGPAVCEITPSLSQIDYQDYVNEALDILYDFCAKKTGSNKLPGRLQKRQKAMLPVAALFRQEIDVNRSGVFVISQLEKHLVGEINGILFQWFRQQLSPDQRRAFLEFCAQSGGVDAQADGHPVRIKHGLVLKAIEDCFEIRI